jgi:hydrogenase expression/formation protein HypC
MCLAVPGKVLAVSALDADRPLRMGRVDFGGVVKEVCLEYVPEADAGDYVIVHVGFAIARLDESEARRSLALWAELQASEREPGAS